MSIVLKRIYEEYRRRFFAYVYRRIHDAETSADIVQTVVMNVLVKIRTEPEFESMPYLVMIAYIYRSLENAVIDHLRKKDVTRRKVQELTESYLVEQTSIRSVEDVVIQKDEDIRCMCLCMEMLSEEDFVLLRDRYYYGISYKILAAEQGVSEEALRQRVSRIKKRLRKAKEDLRHD